MAVVQPLRRLREQARLADPGLAGDGDGDQPGGRYAVDRVEQEAQLVGPPDEGRAGAGAGRRLGDGSPPRW
jgi:hypothetical protein